MPLAHSGSRVLNIVVAANFGRFISLGFVPWDFLCCRVPILMHLPFFSLFDWSFLVPGFACVCRTKCLLAAVLAIFIGLSSFRFNEDALS